MLEKLEKTFCDITSKGNVGHAYLIGNVRFDEIKIELNNVISKYILHDSVNIENSIDINIIKPEGIVITKDQIKELKENIKNTSQVYNKKIYIICECEKMNLYAANSLLKTLEEPEQEIYAFLITDNINNVLDTIKSRCQILFVSSQSLNIMNSENIETAMNFINLLENKKNFAIAYYDKMIKKDIEKKDLKDILNIIEHFYKDCINMKIDRCIEYFEDRKEMVTEISNLNDLKQIIKKSLIINRYMNNMEYNLNTYLLIDKLIIEFGRC